MFDFTTYFIYISLLFVLIGLTNLHRKKVVSVLDFNETPKLKFQHILALLLISFIVGFRYEVGVDWEGYKEAFLSIKNNAFLSYDDQYMEIGYFYINRFIASIGLSYEWMFFTVGFISWLFIFKSVPKLILPLLIFFLFVDEYFFWSMNGVRQFAAMSIFLVATREIINKRLLRYIILILIASLFHQTVLLFIPFYFIPYTKVNKKNVWIILFIISLVIGISDILINWIEFIISYLGQRIKFIGTYARYIESNKFIVDDEVQTGLGYAFRLIVNFTIILLSGKVIKEYPKTVIYFILFFIGAILFNLSYNIQLLGRINGYFLIFRTIVLSISVYHFWHIRKYKIFVFVFCLLYFILFLTAIYNSSNMSSPFNFTF